MLLEERAPLVGEAVELPRIALSAVVERDFRDDTGVDQLLNVLVNRSIADARIEFFDVRTSRGAARDAEGCC